MFDYSGPIMDSLESQMYGNVQSAGMSGSSYDHFMAATMGLGESSSS